MRKRKKKNWLVEMYEENKLYIWVVIGVLLISGITIGVTVGNLDKVEIAPNDDISYIKEENTDITQTNTIPIKEENKDDKIEKKESKIVESKNITDSSTSDKNEKINSTKEQNKNIEAKEEKKELKFIMPLEGDIIKNFSDNTLIYSNTLEEWICHTGIDIEANKAIPVKAIESGIVIGVKQDPRYGYTIIIDHGQGYKSIYCNLSTLDMVYEGKTVEKGQVISGVGDTALFEIKDNTHLHLEIMLNDKYVNPIEIIK